MKAPPLTCEQKARILQLAGQASFGWIARDVGCTKGQVSGTVWRMHGPVHAAPETNLRPRGEQWRQANQRYFW